MDGIYMAKGGRKEGRREGKAKLKGVHPKQSKAKQWQKAERKKSTFALALRGVCHNLCYDTQPHYQLCLYIMLWIIIHILMVFYILYTVHEFRSPRIYRLTRLQPAIFTRQIRTLLM